MRRFGTLLLALLFFGCGPVAIGVGISDLLKDENPDLVNPVVEVLSPEGDKPSATFGIGSEPEFLLRLNKKSARLRTYLELAPLTAQADVNGCPRDNRGDLMERFGEDVGPVESLPAGNFGYRYVIADDELPAPPFETDARLWVRAIDNQGRVICASHTFRVDRQAPGAPTDMEVFATRPHELEVSWEAPGDSDIVGYRVVWDVPVDGAGNVTTTIPADLSQRMAGVDYNDLVDPGAPAAEPDQANVDAEVTKTTLRQLYSLRPHVVQVRAIDIAGNLSPLSAQAEIVVRTRGGPDGRFLDPVAAAVAGEPSQLPGIGDFDGDRVKDLAWVTCRGGEVFVNFAFVTRAADGTLSTDVRTLNTGLTCGPQGGRPTPCVVEDFDLDGDPDLVAAYRGSTGSLVATTLLLGPPGADGLPTIESSASSSLGADREVLEMYAGEFNADGWPDVAILHQFDAETPPSGSAPRGGAVILTGVGGGLLALSSIPFGADEAISTQINGAAAADFDGDGILDLAVADVASIAIAPITAAGPGKIVRIATTAPPDGIAAGDFDGDGVLDIAASNVDGTLTFLRGLGGFAFERGETIDVDDGSAAVVAGDFDGDRVLDVAAAGPALVILGGDGQGGFDPLGEIDLPDLRDAFAVDLDGDDILDLVVSDEDGHFVLGGRGAIGRGWTGSRLACKLPVKELITPDVGPFPGVLILESLDLDRDGALDLAVGTRLEVGTGSILVYPGVSENGRGLGAFRDPIAFVATNAEPIESLAAGDFNGDGIPDLVASTFNGYFGWMMLFAGKADGTLGEATQPFGERVTELVVDDLDRDGRLDLVAADASIEGKSIGATAYFGNGRGGFAAVSLDSYSAPSSAVAAGDFDRNGRGDVAFVFDLTISQTFTRGEIATVLAEPDPAPPRTFADWSRITGSYAGALAAADLNGDGRTDLVSAGSGGTVWIAEAGGTFRAADSFAGAAGGNVVVVRDFDGDRIPDVLAGGQIRFGNGDGTLGATVDAPVPFSVEGGDSGNDKVVVADFDDDGILDIAVTHTTAFGEVEVHLGNGRILER